MAEEQQQPQQSESDALKEKLAAAEKQRDEYLAGWQRAKADFINYKKEELAHLEEVARYGSEDLIKDLITVLDNFDLGLRALEKSGPVEKGIYLIRSQIEDILKKRGLEKITIKPGDSFDPVLAEAIAEIPKDIPEGIIIEEIEPGYKLHDKTLRPARVVVSKGMLATVAFFLLLPSVIARVSGHEYYPKDHFLENKSPVVEFIQSSGVTVGTGGTMTFLASTNKISEG